MDLAKHKSGDPTKYLLHAKNALSAHALNVMITIELN